MNEGAAVCRHCGFAFDPALISSEQPAPRRKKSGFTKQHSVVAPPGSQEHAAFEGARTDASQPPARTASTGEVDDDDAEPDVDVFATQPAGAPVAALDEFRDLSHDVTERGPARDLPPEPQDVAATIVQDMASALAAYGLRDVPSSPPPEEPVERTVISPPPRHHSSSEE